MTERRYLIGIDLGTTHTVVAYIDTGRNESAAPAIFNIEQLVGPGELASLPLLPSFRYHCNAEEFSPGDIQLPWSKPGPEGDLPDVIIGEWARELGQRTQGRQVVSAKSWLSHKGIEPNADILPWTDMQGVAKVSPVMASASYLHHVRQAWDHAHPHHPMARQHVVVTVPASFDDGARSLTLAAAKLAGLDDILLLEEPQAVVYDWYWRHQQDAAQLLEDVPVVMVADVGGGTTDLSLIAASHRPDFTLNRIGVGDHLMLGGDNIDYSLAYQVEQQLGQGGRLRAASLSALIQQTRQAKENLLAENAPDTARVTMLGSGSKLIGGARSVELSRDKVRDTAVDGFFPLVAQDSLPATERSAVQEFGLPFERDPAITRHLAGFIQHHQAAIKSACPDGEDDGVIVPQGLLLNGGVFNSPLIQQRVIQQFEQWSGKPVTLLDNPHPDLAVAHGAVAYAMARRGQLLKIGGGSPRSYFLQVEDKSKQALGVCILPKGCAEGDEVALAEQRFMLSVGEPVRFNLLSTTDDTVYKPGEKQPLDLPSLISLPPMIASLARHEGEADASRQYDRVPVTLSSQMTEVGTIRVDCVSQTPANSAYYQQRWTLEFEARKASTQAVSPGELDKHKLQQALARIDTAYGGSKKNPDPKDVKQLRQDLERLLGKRESWSTPLLRELASGLLAGRKRRRRSQQHEQNWLRLSGYCMRPGFGFAADEWRMEQIWALYSQGLQFKHTASWADWWTFWRRVCGGLSAAQQQHIYKDIAKYVQPAASRNKKLATEAAERSYVDMVRLLASLDKLPADNKTEMVGWLSQRVQKSQHAQVHWWAIGRIGARMPLSGSSHTMISAEHVQQWLTDIAQIDWQQQPEVGFAVVMMSMKTGDRSRDIDDESREMVLNKLRASKLPESWQTLVQEVKTLDEEQSKRFYGEALPSGLQLM